MILNTSAERVDALMRHSDEIYSDIDPLFDGEPRHRRMLRVGMTTLAVALRNGESIEQAGSRLLQLDFMQPQQQGSLDTLFNKYADIERGTFDQDGKHETDSRHAVHLLKLGVPYAAQYYPHLKLGTVAAYFLAHDLPEAYAGDVQSLGMSPEQERLKIANEAQALVTLQHEYGTAWPEFVQFVIGYEELSEPEIEYVRTFDKLDPGFTHFENKGLALRRFNRDSFYHAVGQTTQRMARYSASFPQLMEDRMELTKRVADASF